MYAWNKWANLDKNLRRIIYLGPAEAFPAAQAVLEPSWMVVAAEADRQSVAAQLRESVTVLDASMKVRFDRSLLESASQLRLISTATTGADHIDSEVLEERGISLFTLAGEKDILNNLTPAAEHSWTLLMACARRLRGAIEGNLFTKPGKTEAMRAQCSSL